MKLTEKERRLIAGSVFFTMATLFGKDVAGVVQMTACVIGLFKEMEFDTFDDLEKSFLEEKAKEKTKEGTDEPASTPSTPSA